MNTDLARPLPSAPPERSFVTDDRGAIMVMGIFMCVFLVGALWYIAGIGESLIFHERMQEASDAVAFSSAAILARGMNMLVMINLVMAAILAVRVAINLAIYATLAFAAVMFAIGAALEAFFGAGTPFIAAGTAATTFEQEVLQNIHDELSPVVTDALEALHDVEEGIWYAVPPAAQAAAVEIATEYAPTISPIVPVFTGNSGTPLVAMGHLPVAWGTTHKLCMKSFDALKGALNDLLASSGSIIVGPVEAIANAIGASDLFCELGDSGTSNDPSSALNSVGAASCSSDPGIKATCTNAANEQTHVNTLETQCNYVNGLPPNPPPVTPPDPSCPNIPQLQAQATSDQQTCNNKQSSCASGSSNGATGAMPAPPAKGSGSGQNPTMVDTSWHNGIDAAQLLATVAGDGKSTTYSPKFVKIASQGKIPMHDPSGVQLTAWSQAEFFYDCSGAWSSCNAQEEAMWNFHWRARFRLVNPEAFGPVGAALEVAQVSIATHVVMDLFGSLSQQASLSGYSPARSQFAKDVSAVLTPPLSLALH